VDSHFESLTETTGVPVAPIVTELAPAARRATVGLFSRERGRFLLLHERLSASQADDAPVRFPPKETAAPRSDRDRRTIPTGR